VKQFTDRDCSSSEDPLNTVALEGPDMRGRAIVAALSLAAVTVFVTLGTIWNAGDARAHCQLDQPCPREITLAEPAEPDLAALTNREWEASAHQFLARVELGFMQLAGVPSGPY